MNNFDSRAFALIMDSMAREDFAFFTMRAFEELYDIPFHPNWHIQAIAHQLTGVAKGKTRRLIVTMPPRSLKSFMGSICFPAWILGRKPGEKIVCASYAQDLSKEFAFETRRLMQTEWYRNLFPNTILDPRKSSTEILATTRGGQRRSTSVAGSLTGLGGNLIVIDDPMKAADADSEVARENVMQWYGGTVASRLNDPKKGRIIVIAQRLHQEDLPGQLLATGNWEHLDLPLIEWKERKIEIAPHLTVIREAGTNLHEERIDEEQITRLRNEMGERAFEAQYNQRPLPPGGALFKGGWLRRYDCLPQIHETQLIVQSWDCAYETDGHNDYSVCSTWAVSGHRYFLLDIYRARLEFPDLEKAIYAQRKRWKADLVIVEDIGAGKSLRQNIRRAGDNLWLQPLSPQGSKQDRASQQSPKFERGRVWLPREAEWLRTFEEELLACAKTRKTVVNLSAGCLFSLPWRLKMPQRSVSRVMPGKPDLIPYAAGLRSRENWGSGSRSWQRRSRL